MWSRDPVAGGLGCVKILAESQSDPGRISWPAHEQETCFRPSRVPPYSTLDRCSEFRVLQRSRDFEPAPPRSGRAIGCLQRLASPPSNSAWKSRRPWLIRFHSQSMRQRPTCWSIHSSRLRLWSTRSVACRGARRGTWRGTTEDGTGTMADCHRQSDLHMSSFPPASYTLLQLFSQLQELATVVVSAVQGRRSP